MSDARRMPSLHFALFGLWFVWSTPFGTTETTVFPSFASQTDELFASRLTLLIAFGLSCLAFVIVGRFVEQVRERRILVWVASGCIALGMLLSALCAVSLDNVILLCAGAALRGLGSGPLVLAWLENLSTLDARRVGVALFSALILYALAGVIVQWLAQLSPLITIIVLVCCPLVSCWGCCRITHQHEVVPRPVPMPEPMSWRSRLLFMASNLVYGFLYGIMLAYYSTLGNTLLYAVFGVVAALVGVGFALWRGSIDLGWLFRIYIAVVAIALSLAILLLSTQQIVIAAFAAGIWAVQIFFTIVIFVDTELNLPGAPCTNGGLALFFAALGIVLATLLLPPGNLSSLNDLPLFVALFGSTLYLAAIFLPNGRTWVRSWGFSSFVRPESHETFLTRCCGELTAEYQLTSREFEILQMLVRDYNKESVGEALFISPYTAKTHMRNLYAKLNVHSHEELIALFNGTN